MDNQLIDTKCFLVNVFKKDFKFDDKWGRVNFGEDRDLQKVYDSYNKKTNVLKNEIIYSASFQQAENKVSEIVKEDMKVSADNLIKKSDNQGKDFQLLIKYNIKSNYEIHIYGFTDGSKDIVNTHYIHNYSEENIVYGDVYACKFNQNNNTYNDLPTKEYEDFYMNCLENTGIDNSVDIEEESDDNDELLEDDDDDDLKLLSKVKNINRGTDDCEDNMIEELDIESDVESDLDFSDEEIFNDNDETSIFIDKNNLEPEPYTY